MARRPPVDRLSATNPPSAAMPTWVVARIGLCLPAAPPMRRLPDSERVWRAVRPVGVAVRGLAPDGRLPVLPAPGLALRTALGTALVTLLPWTTARRVERPEAASGSEPCVKAAAERGARSPKGTEEPRRATR